MTWFKVDDTLAFHDKTVAAGNAAMGLWVRAGSWSAQMLTDGVIPSHMARALGSDEEAASLVNCGLWSEHPRGFAFNGWDDFQFTRDEVEAKRQYERDRKRQQRQAGYENASRGTDGQFQPVSQRDTNGDDLRDSTQESPATRPVPSQSPKDSLARKRATQLPAGWQPTDRHREVAAENGIDLEHEAEQFRNHHTAKGSTFKNWNSAFSTWLGNAKKWSRPTPAPAHDPDAWLRS